MKGSEKSAQVQAVLGSDARKQASPRSSTRPFTPPSPTSTTATQRMTAAARRPKIDLAALLSEQNPRIDLKLDAYERSTKTFLASVREYADIATREIMDRRERYEAERRKHAEKAALCEEQTNQAKSREIEVLAEMEKEREERVEVENSVEALRRQLRKVEEKFDTVDADLAERQARAEDLRNEKKRDRAVLAKNQASLARTVAHMQQLLGLQVEGLASDVLMFRFTSVDPAAPDREFNFVLDVSTEAYKVLASEPVLPSMHTLLEEANETSDIWRFVVRVRQAFQESTGAKP